MKRALVGALGLALAAALGMAIPALAHGEDPALVPVLRAVTPALPAELAVQVRTGVSEQMIVGNRTAEPLLVLDPDGDAFLRVSTQGAFGNVADPFFHRTLNPPGVPVRLPAAARQGAVPEWVKLSPGESWDWFEPRLHPFDPGKEPLAPPGRTPSWPTGRWACASTVRSAASPASWNAAR